MLCFSDNIAISYYISLLVLNREEETPVIIEQLNFLELSNIF
jgi:hypothetical protein